jgi:phosphatidate cytidylyltransferase
VLKHRIISGCALGAGLILATRYLPGIGIWALLVIISALAQLEFCNMLKLTGIPCFKVGSLIAGSALITATFVTIGPTPEALARSYRAEHLVLAATLMALFVRQFPQKYNLKPLETIACTLLGIWYVPYLFNFFTRLAFAWDGAGALDRVGRTGCLMVLYLVVVVKATDIGAYSIGRLFGRHKLFPRISPGKTWEGLFGGIAAALLASWVFWTLTKAAPGRVALRLSDAVILGLLLSIVGVVGDMFESLLKRAAGMKDSGTTIPGMGGLLDVLDSLLFGAPVLYLYVQWVVP